MGTTAVTSKSGLSIVTTHFTMASSFQFYLGILILCWGDDLATPFIDHALVWYKTTSYIGIIVQGGLQTGISAENCEPPTYKEES